MARRLHVGELVVRLPAAEAGRGEAIACAVAARLGALPIGAARLGAVHVRVAPAEPTTAIADAVARALEHGHA